MDLEGVLGFYAALAGLLLRYSASLSLIKTSSHFYYYRFIFISSLIDLVTQSFDNVNCRYDKEYHHRRWVCYCIFSIKKETTGDFLPMLFFNQTRKTFHLIVFQLDHHRKLMHKTSEHLLKIDPVEISSFCYAAHKDSGKVEVS